MGSQGVEEGDGAGTLDEGTVRWGGEDPEVRRRGRARGPTLNTVLPGGSASVTRCHALCSRLWVCASAGPLLHHPPLPEPGLPGGSCSGGNCVPCPVPRPPAKDTSKS